MIAQFIDVINKNDNPLINTISGFSANRFYNDRVLSIPPNQFQPILGGRLNGEREVYILYFKINNRTTFQRLRLRILNGNIFSFTRGIDKSWVDEVSIDVARMRNIQLAINFDCNPAYGSWVLQFGTESGWDYCPLSVDNFALIRASKPKDSASMELPRFLVGPQSSFEVLGEDLRGSVGQPHGRTIRQLRTFSVEFARVNSCAIDDYFREVSITKPHFIVPYPENVEHIPPMWCTLMHPPQYEKRNEHGWYWNARLSWKEAY